MRTKILVFVALLSSVAAAQTGGTFDLSHNVIATGGGSSTGNSQGRTYRVDGTIGQGIAGTNSTSASPQFSVEGGFWGFRSLVPTAASVSVSGRVLSSQGRGLAMVRVTLTSSTETLTAITNAFGHFSFGEVSVGENYIVSVQAKRFQFTPRVLVVNDEISDLDLIAAGP